MKAVKLCEAEVYSEETESQHCNVLKTLSRCQQIAFGSMSSQEKMSDIFDIILNTNWLNVKNQGGVFLTNNNQTAMALSIDRGLCNKNNDYENHRPIAYTEQHSFNNDNPPSSRQFNSTVTFNFPGIDKQNKICVPLIIDNVIEGVILLFGTTSPNIEKSDRLFLKMIADLYGSIIEHERTKALARLSRKDLENQISAMDEHSIICTLNKTKSLIGVNQRFTDISGFSEKELLGGHFCIGLSDDQDESFFEEISNTINVGNVWRGEICNRNINNEKYWTKTTIVPFIDNNNKIYKYVVISTDISEVIEARKNNKN